MVILCFRNKYLLLNSQELNELSAICQKADIPEVEALANTDRYAVWSLIGGYCDFVRVEVP